MEETKKQSSMPSNGQMPPMHHNDCGPWCSGWHGNHMFGRFSMGFWLMRLLFMVVMLLFVFWLGVKVGEVKSIFDGGSNHRVMMYQNGEMGTFPGGTMRSMPNGMYMVTPQTQMAPVPTTQTPSSTKTTK